MLDSIADENFFSMGHRELAELEARSDFDSQPINEVRSFFRTREGNLGMLKILGLSDNGDVIRIQYKGNLRQPHSWKSLLISPDLCCPET